MAGPAVDNSSGLQIALVIGEVLLAAILGFQRWLFSRVWETLATKTHVTNELTRFHDMDVLEDSRLLQDRVKPIEDEQERLANTLENWRREWREDLHSTVRDLRADIRANMQELIREARKP